MRRKWLKLAVLLSLPIILLLPLNYLVRSRRPVTVDIGRMAEKDQKKVSVRALSQLLHRYPRAAKVKVVWRVKAKREKMLYGFMSYDRGEGVLGLAMPIPSRKHIYSRGCWYSEKNFHKWADQGKIATANVDCFGVSNIEPYPQ